MLSLARRFLFIHIPKTGGNSIQDALRGHVDDEIVCTAPHHDGVERFEVRSRRYRTEKHSTLADYRREYGAELFDGLYKFTCVRNPWDRALSYYFSPHRGEVAWTSEDFVRFLDKVEPVRHYLTLGPHAPGLAPALKAIDRVMRFESLQADFEAVCASLGLPAVTLPFRNRSSRASYRDYYDTKTAELVRSRFRDEIEQFGYAY